MTCLHVEKVGSGVKTPSILICTYSRRSPAANQRLKCKSKWVTVRGSTSCTMYQHAACLVSCLLGVTCPESQPLQTDGDVFFQVLQHKRGNKKEETKQTHDQKNNQANQEIEECIFTLQLFSVIMAFDTQDTNTIVTLHSSGGQQLLQVLQTQEERLWIQTGGWTTWRNEWRNKDNVKTHMVQVRLKAHEAMIYSRSLNKTQMENIENHRQQVK